MSSEPAHSPLAIPQVDGPKLEPFDFQGQQNIEFVSKLGHGCHSEVFHVKINHKDYALKVFGFLRFDSLFIDIYNRPTDRKATHAIGQYVDPFFAECRAFGRLQETGYEELAIKCHGYILLSQEQEDVVVSLLRKTHDILAYRSFYHDKNEPPPPLRCLVKDLGAPTRLTQKLIWKLFSNVKQLHQLGIFHLDLKMEQLIDGKLADFSLAKTMPHFITNPELNPELPTEWTAITRAETWQFCSWDYESLDEMVDEWNHWRYPKRPLMPPCATTTTEFHERYSFRRRSMSTSFVYANPYLSSWETRLQSHDKARLEREPLKWFKSHEDHDKVNEMMGSGPMMMWWEYRDGLINPIGNGFTFAKVNGRMQRVQRKPMPPETDEEIETYKRVNGQLRLAWQEWEANGGLQKELDSEKWWKNFANQEN